MPTVQLGFLDYAILFIYVAFVIGIGFALRRYMKSSSDFLTSGRSIPAWVTGLAFISANLGALELVGMAASGAKYGIATCHFYWVGAIPAMIFLAVFMMPFYYGSKARSVPEYLKMRFDERVRALNSIAFAVMTVFASGISMNALAKLLNQLLGWNYHVALWICSAVVLVYVLKGGLTSAIYTEVLQFFMIVLGFAPVVYLGLKDVGGWNSMNHSLQTVAQNPSACDVRRDFLEQFNPFRCQIVLVCQKAGGIAARPRHACDKGASDRIRGVNEYDRDRARGLQNLGKRRSARGEDNVRRKCRKLCCVPPKKVWLARGPSIVDLHIPPVDPTQRL